MTKTSAAALSIFVFVISGPSLAASTITYSDYASFDAATGLSIVDTYSDPGYTHGDRTDGTNSDIFSDAAMSAVLGETQYSSSGFNNLNIVERQSTNPDYCAGCNGSFLLTFTSTSVGTSDGVSAVGFNFFNSPSQPYHAYVTFGDDTTADYVLSSGSGLFWGISSDRLIRSIHLGLANGSATQGGSFGIDNLELAQVPEPASLAIFGAGMILVAARLRRKNSKNSSSPAATTLVRCGSGQ